MTETLPQSSSSSGHRLNKFVALSLGVSRRHADDLIFKGSVLVNDTPAILGKRITDDDRVLFEGRELKPLRHQLITLHKPVDYLCSRASQGGVPTIYDLLPPTLGHLKTVGRLDKDSSGIILLTNDGDLAHSMTHPSFYKVKRYEVQLSKPLQPLHQQMINDFGIQLPDGPSKLTLERMTDGDSRNWIIEMSEGRNRQIRRTFEALSYTVQKLHRTNFGKYSLGDMKLGEWREVNIP